MKLEVFDQSTRFESEVYRRLYGIREDSCGLWLQRRGDEEYAAAVYSQSAHTQPRAYSYDWREL